MSVLFFTGSPPQYMAPPRLAPDQINCGPSFSTEHYNGFFRSLRTPRGEYNVMPLIGSLRHDQLPSAVVCLVDSSRQSVPRNLASLPCPKILLVADTHHLDRPLRWMLDYIAAEKFDRVVLLYDRHHAEIFRAAGVNNLFWFPGLTFPHPDAQVRAAISPQRAKRVALVGQIGAFHPRRLRLAGALARAGLPLEIAVLPQARALEFYGASAVTFNASLNGDLNLRIFEAMAAGSALLTDRLSPSSGMDQLWTEGRHLMTYSGAEDLVERARHLVDRPDEAARIGQAGSEWFWKYFSADQRMEAFGRLMYDGRPHPRFALTSGSKRFFLPAEAPSRQAALAAYEAVQDQHLREETVRLACDGVSPSSATALWQTLPRVKLDLEGAPFTARVGADWAFSGSPAAAVPSEAAVRQARKLLDSGELSDALAAARRALEQNPLSVDALLVIAELAADSKQPQLREKMLARAQQIDPLDPRVALALLPVTGVPAAQRQTALAWRHWEGRDLKGTSAAAARALAVDDRSAEAYFVSGLAAASAGQTAAGWVARGKALRSLASAAELAPAHLAYVRELAWARLKSGGLNAEAVPAFRAALALDPSGVAEWLGLGYALLNLDRPEEAETVLREGLRRSPVDFFLMRALGYAVKRQGRIDESLPWLARGFGGYAPVSRVRKAGKPLALFVAQNGTAWHCMASVHAAFTADPAWRTLVVALPYNHPSFAASGRIENQTAIFGFLEAQGIPFVRWDEFQLDGAAPDLLFLQNPYDVTRPPGWTVPELIRGGHRICYVPYAIEFGGNHEDVLFQFNLPLQQTAWAVAARYEAHRALFREHCQSGDRHVVVTGHPKFDQYFDGNPPPPDPALLEFAAGRPLVLWTPHFDVRFDGTRWGDGYSTFLRWGKFIPEEFARRPELAFVIRPHPCFFSSLEEREILSRSEMTAWISRCEAAGNVRFNSGGDYFPVLAAADALISDASSIIFEYGVSGKPVAYLHNPAGPVAKLDYELDLDCLRQHALWLTTEDQIRAFLDGVTNGSVGSDPLRASEMRRRMGVRPGGAGAAFKRELELRLAAAGEFTNEATG